MKPKRTNPLFAGFFRKNLVSASAVISLAFGAGAGGQSISVNFGAGNVVSEAGIYTGAFPVVGNLWNNPAGNNGTNVTLNDSGGNPTGLITWTSANIWSSVSPGATGTSENGDLTKNYLDDGSGGPVINLVSPYLISDIYLVPATDSASYDPFLINGVYFRGNGTDSTLPALPGQTWVGEPWTTADDMVEGVNYLKVAAQPAVVIAGPNSGGGRASIAGLQVVNAYEDGTLAYWDLDGDTAGAGGGTAPTGVWNGVNTNWSSSAAGDVATGTWSSSSAAVFSAGTTATGAYTVLVQAAQDADGVWARNGTVTLGDGGLGAQLNLTGPAVLRGDTGLTVDIPVSATSLTTAGAVTLNNSANTISGLATIYGSTTLGANHSFGSLAGGGTLALGTRTLNVGGDNTDSVFAGLLTGTASIGKSGPGRLTLLNNNTGFTGATTVSGGFLRLGSGGNTGSIGGTIEANATVEFFRNDTSVHTIANAFTGSGTLSFIGTNVSLQSQYDLLGSTAGFTGAVTIDDSRLRIDPGDFDNTSSVTVFDGGQAWMQAGAHAENYFLNGIGWTETGGQLGAIRLENTANITGSVTVSTPSRIVAYGTTGTISGPLLGSGDLEINFDANANANGTVNLSNASGFNGTLLLSRGTVNVGALGGGLGVSVGTANVTGAVAGTTGIASGVLNLNNGASIGSPAVTGGTVNVNAGGSVTGALDMPTATTLGLGGGSVGGGITLGSADTDAHTLNYTGTLAVTGNLTASGTQTVNLINQPPVGGTVTLLTYTGTATDPVDSDIGNNFVLAGGGTASRSATFTDTGSSITLAVGNVNLTWAGADGTNPTFWDAGSTSTPNWTGGDTRFYNGDAVTFSDSATGTAVAMQSLLTPSAVTFSNTAKDFTVTGGAGTGITGSTGITKSGTGTLTLGGAGSTFTGPVAINGGLLNLNNGEALGFNSGVTIAAGGAFNFNGHAPANQGRHYTYTIAGQGTDGAGGLGAIHTTGGDIAANAGIRNLVLSANAEIGGNNGRFDVGLSGGVFGAIDGGGFTLTKVGSNMMVFRAPAADISYVLNSGTLIFEDWDTASGSNPITVNGGTLGTWAATAVTRTIPNDVTFTASGATLISQNNNSVWTGGITLNGNTTFTATGSLVIDGSLAGTGNISKTGAGILALQNSAGSYSGKISATAGTLRIESAAAIGTATGADVLTLGGTTLQGGTISAQASATIGSATQGITLTGALNFAAGAGNTLTINSPITGTGNLQKNNNAGDAVIFNQPVSSTLSNFTSINGTTEFNQGLSLTWDAEQAKLRAEQGNILKLAGTSGFRELEISTATVNIGSGATVTYNMLEMSQGGGTQSVVNQTGGTVNFTGTNNTSTTSASFLMGHWGSGSASTYNLSGGSLNAAGAVMSLGWDSTNVNFDQSGGTANFLGINLNNGRNFTAAYNMTGGRLNLGATGITNASNKSINLGGGTVGAFANWSSAQPMTLTGTGGNVTVNTLDSVDATTARSITLTGVLSGTGGLTKAGAGTLTLSAANTYTGPTAVDAGKLHLGTASASTVSANPGGTIQPGTPPAAATATVAGLVMNGGTAHFRGTYTAGDRIVVSGEDAFTVPSASTITVQPAGDLLPGDYITLIDYNGEDLSPAAFGNLALTASSNPHIDWELYHDVGDTSIQLHIISADSLTWKGNAGAAWDVNNTSNWVLDSDGITSSKYYDYDTVTFDDTGISTPNVTLAGAITPGAVFVGNDSGVYTFSGSPIGGTAALSKTAGGGLVLLNENNYIGATSITGGSVTVGNGGATGALGGSGNITLSNASLIFNRSDAQSLGRTVTGTGGVLVKNGANTLTMNAAGNTCDIVINSGTLAARGGGWTASFAANRTITVNAPGVLDTATHNLGGLGGATRPDNIVINEDAVWKLNNEQQLPNTAVTMTAGIINGPGQVRGSGTIATAAHATKSSVINAPVNTGNGAVTFNVADGDVADDLSVTGNIDGINTITKTGAGTMVPTGSNVHTGGTSLTGGTLVISSIADAGGVGSIGTYGGTGDTGYLGIANDATFRYTGTGAETTTRYLWIDTGTQTKTIEVANATGDITFNSTGGNVNKPFRKTGPGALTINDVMQDGTTVTVDAGRLTLGGANTYTGDTVVNAGGTLVVNGDSIADVGRLDINGSGKVEVTGTELIDTLWINGVQMGAGSYGATGSGAVNIDDTHFAGTGVVQVSTAPPAGFDTWAAQIPDINERDRGDDPDSDGFTNIQEFLFGTDPMAGNGSLVTSTASGGNLVLVWLQRETGSTYALLESLTMATGTWAPSAVTPVIDPDQGGVPTDYDRFRAVIPITGNRLFFRVEGSED